MDGEAEDPNDQIEAEGEDNKQQENDQDKKQEETDNKFEIDEVEMSDIAGTEVCFICVSYN